MAPLAVGSVFAGYRLEAVAGRGGMGVVYRARQLRPDRLVALKVIAPDYAQDAVFRQRFERESEAAASLEHPNVIPVYQVDEVDGLLFLAMRFVDGADLHALIGAGLEPLSAVRIVEQVAGALDAAHAAGLVHRDVKPANVLVADVGGQPHAYLTDFGLAQRTAASRGLTRTGTFMGTVDYAAPEQIRGERVDARTDVYALACVLYESLTREVPYPRDSAPATMFAHLDAVPPSVAERGLPAATDEVIRRGMAKDPDERYPSAGDLAQAAVAVFEGRPVSRRERTVAVGEAAPRIETVADETVTGPSADAPVATATSGPVADAPASPGRRRAALIAVPLVLVAAAAAAAIALSGDGDGSEGGRGAGPPALTAEWSAPVGGYPFYAAVAGGESWVVLQGADRLKRVSADGRTVSDTDVLGTNLGALVADGDGLLVGVSGEDDLDGRGTVLRIDPATGAPEGRAIRTIDPVEIATDGESLWVTDLAAVDAIDLATGRRLRRIPLRNGIDVAVRDGTAWVAIDERGELVAFDARTGEQRGRPIDVGARPMSVSATADAVWVTTEQGELVRVPSDGDGPPESLVVGGEASRFVAAGDDGVWVVDEHGNVVLVDPAELRVRGRLRLGGTLEAVAIDGDAAVVARARSTEESTLVRVSSGATAQ